MNLFALADLKPFTGENVSDPTYNVARTHALNQLAWLHEKIYGEIRGRRWDLYYRPDWSLPAGQVTAATPVVERLELKYTKSDTVARLMHKQYGGARLDWDELSRLAIGLDAHGVFVEWRIPAAARLDAQNFFNKVTEGAPEKRTLRQIFAEVSGEGVLTLLEEQQPVERLRCARLVDLNVLNTLFARFVPGKHEWLIAMRFLVTDPRLQSSAAPDELLYRLAQLYSLHQFAAWSPRNNFVNASLGESNSNTIS